MLAQEVSEAPEENSVPKMLRGIPLGPTMIRWEFLAVAKEGEKFILEDEYGKVLADEIPKKLNDFSFFDEKNLLPNTSYFRRIRDKDGGASEFLGTFTLFPAPSELIIRSVGEKEASLGVDNRANIDFKIAALFDKIPGKAAPNVVLPDLMSLSMDRTSYLFRNVTSGVDGKWGIGAWESLTSLESGKDYQFSVKVRNALGVETPFSSIFSFSTLRPADLRLDVAVVSSFGEEKETRIFYPGDVIHYTVYIKNKSSVPADGVYFLSRIGEGYRGKLSLDHISLSDSRDQDSGDFSVTSKGAVFVKLGEFLGGVTKKIKFDYQIPPSSDFPAILDLSSGVGAKNMPYLIIASVSDRVGRILPNGEASDRGLSGLFSGRGIYQEVFLESPVTSLGGPGMILLSKKEALADQALIDLLVSSLDPLSLRVLNKKVFRGVLASQKEDRFAFEEEARVSLSVEDHAIESLSDSLAFSWLESQKKNEQTEPSMLSPLSIEGKVTFTDGELVMQGHASGQANVDISIVVNQKEAGKTVTSPVGSWEYSVSPLLLVRSSERGIVRFNVSVLAKRKSGQGEPIEKSLGSVDVDLSGLSVEEEPKILAFSAQELAVDPSLAEALGARVGRGIDVLYGATQAVVEQTAKVVRENESTFQTTLVVVAPVVSVASPALLSAIPTLPTYLFYFVSWFLSLLGIRKKNKSWGVVYDSITKDAVSLAIVRLFRIEQKESGMSALLVETQVTDQYGRYGFIPKLGEFYIEVQKPEYNYPSALVPKGLQSDDTYINLYHRQRILIQIEDASINFDIPIDPKEPAVGSRDWKNTLFEIRTGFGYLSRPLAYLGATISWVVVAVSFNILNVSIALIYLGLALFEWKRSRDKNKPWGIVFDSLSKNPISLANISIVDAQYGRTLKSRLTDYGGRFNFFPPPGFYRMLVSKEGYQFPSQFFYYKDGRKKMYFGEKFSVDKQQPIVNADVPLDGTEIKI